MSNEAREKIAPFVRKLWKVLEGILMPDAFQWDSEGKEVEIKLQNCDDFKLKEELGIQISSLDRQMRNYGFKKNARASQGGKLVYHNPYFQKDRKELLSHIKREDHKEKSKNTNASAVNANTLQEERNFFSHLLRPDKRKWIERSQVVERLGGRILNIQKETLDLKVGEGMPTSPFKIEEETSNLKKGNSDTKTIEDHYKQQLNKPTTERDALLNAYKKKRNFFSNFFIPVRREQVQSSRVPGKLHDEMLDIQEEPLILKIEERMSTSPSKTEEEKSNLKKGNSDPKAIEDHYKQQLSKLTTERDALLDGYGALKHQKDELEERLKARDGYIAFLESQNNSMQLLYLRLQHKLEEYEKLISAGKHRVPKIWDSI